MVRWPFVCPDKRNDGLEIKSLPTVNIALLRKNDYKGLPQKGIVFREGLLEASMVR